MASISDKEAEENAEILEEAKARWQLCQEHWSGQYENSTEDWKFLHGESQWDQGAKASREKEGRPTLTLNQLLPYAQQAINDIKQARLAIRVVPIDSEADVKTAEIRAGIIRNIEKQSKAKTVYGTAAMNAIGAGIGWMRIKAEYSDLQSFEQEALIERVLDFTSVFLDPQSTELDGSDAEYGFVRVDYTKERFEELYPDFSPVSYDSSTLKEEVSIVEYYYKNYTPDTLTEIELIDEAGDPVRQVGGKKLLKSLDDAGLEYEKIRSRDIEVIEVRHCVLSGADVISNEEFPSTFIPLIPVVGEEVYINGKRECHSLIAQAKDAQRMYNYWKSASTEMIALQPKTPWVAPVGSFKSYSQKWAAANTQNFAFLEYDIVMENGMPLPPPTRAPPIQGSPSMMQEAIGAREDIRLGIGMPQSNMGERSNAISGVAIRNQQIEGDNATFHFIDNLSTSIAQVGRILDQLISVLYSERKIARIIGDDGTEESMPVNVPYIKTEEGVRAARANEQPEGIYDMAIGKYDIDMDVGASYASGRQETADKLIELAKVKPEILDVAGDILFDVLDMPMGKEIAERLKAQMPPEMLGDDPQAARLQQAADMIKQMEEQIANMDAALQDKETSAKFDQAVKAEEQQLNRDKFEVDSQKTKADIDKIYSDIQGGAEANAANQNIDAIINQVTDLSQTVELLMDNLEEDINENAATFEPELIEEQAIESET